VMFDYQEELPVRVPEDVKLAIVNLENA